MKPPHANALNRLCTNSCTSFTTLVFESFYRSDKFLTTQFCQQQGTAYLFWRRYPCFLKPCKQFVEQLLLRGHVVIELTEREPRHRSSLCSGKASRPHTRMHSATKDRSLPMVGSDGSHTPTHNRSTAHSSPAHCHGSGSVATAGFQSSLQSDVTSNPAIRLARPMRALVIRRRMAARIR